MSDEGAPDIKELMRARQKARPRTSTTLAVIMPCVHEGGITERCPQGNEAKHVRECDLHDTCTRGPSRIKSCAGCADYSSATPAIAPIGGFEGTPEARRPWQSRVTVAIPHLDTFDQIALAVELWRMQTVKPFIQIVDTGSPWNVVDKLETLRSEDVEIHYVRAHAYRHSSAPVTVALDLSQSLCRTTHIFHTHADVFPLRRDFLAWMMPQCSPGVPVVGWQMSPRNGCDEWKECVSHTATMLHMPTARVRALWWSMERHYDERPEDRRPTVGWPDTESPFLFAMRAAGVKPKLLGTEPNFQRHSLTASGVAWADHARSYTGIKMMPGDHKHARITAYMADAEREARQRLAEWRSQA